MKEIKGLVTGIGSLPYKDANEALDLVFEYTPRIPFWPQLPQRDKREGMIMQFSQALPCLRLSQKGLYFDSAAQEEELAQFYEQIIANNSQHFAISADFAAGLWQFHARLQQQGLEGIEFIKGQVTGPFTFAASVNDDQGRAILHNPILFQAVREGLAMKARWQIELFKSLSKPTIMFLDEPYLACFGSGFTPINRQEVVKVLTEFSEKIKCGNGLIGVHCCGNTDWSIFSEIAAMDIISFDAYNFLERVLLYAKEISAFLKRGGILAWGIVPTEGFGPEINPGILAERLRQGFEVLFRKGIDRDLLKQRLLLTPSCGLGSLGAAKAEPIFKCLAGISAELGSGK